MSIKIEVISTQNETKPTSKGSYQLLSVAYKNLTFNNKVEGRKVASFGNTAAAFKELTLAKQGDVYEIEVVKNDKTGYNDWVNAKKSASSSGGTSSQAPHTNSASTISRTNTYETPEERAKKQIYIVRQSSISSAIDLLSVGSKSAPAVDDVIKVATQFEAYVFGDEPDDDSGMPEDISDSDVNVE